MYILIITIIVIISITVVLYPIFFGDRENEIKTQNKIDKSILEKAIKKSKRKID